MRRIKWLLLVLPLLLAGCSLARAEAGPEDGSGDRWVGFYVMPSRGYVDHLADNPYREEYGTISAEADKLGTLAFPREVLFAVEDEAGNYTFPGLEQGYSLFVHRFYEEGSDHGGSDYSVGITSNMAPGEETTQFRFTDEGISEIFSGRIYYGPPLGVTDWDANLSNTIWRFYRVYQARDGRIYLDGSGDSSNGGFTHTLTDTRTRTENGETYTDITQATVEVRAVSRLERLVVTQFDDTNAILQSEDLSLRNDRPEIHCLAETAWLLVEEISADGTTRTAYNVPEREDEPVSHLFILLDDDGFGMPAYLNLHAYPRTVYAR